MKCYSGYVELDRPGETLPPALAGTYYQVSPTVYRIIFPLCIHHDYVEKVVGKCGKIIGADHCDFHKVFISPNSCKICTQRKES